MRRPRLATAALVIAAIAFAPVSTSATDGDDDRGSRPRVFEPEGLMEAPENDCLQLTGPAAASPAGLTGGGTIDLHVRLVLDVAEGRALDATPDNPGTTGDERQAAIDAFGRAIARDYLDAGRQSYEPFDVRLRYGSFDLLETADLRSGTRAATMAGRTAIDTAKDQYGGRRPEGTDIVYVLSDRDLTDGTTGSGLAGLADCIGGVSYPTRAFATGELDRSPEIGLIVADAYVEFTAKVAAHEVGHLMGAHHHYQACGPYAATNYLDGYGVGACTLMTNFVDFTTFPFSPTNQVVVRGHAEKWAIGNDDQMGETPDHGEGGDGGEPDHDHHAD